MLLPGGAVTFTQDPPRGQASPGAAGFSGGYLRPLNHGETEPTTETLREC